MSKIRTTRKHIHREVFATTPQRLFAALHTPSAICRWWSAASAIVLARPGGTFAATWGSDPDAPDYITTATLRDFDPPHRMVLTDYRYFAKAGPLPFEADFVTEFVVEAHQDGATLTETQDGFPVDPSADAFYQGCEIGWRNTFAGIRAFLAERIGRGSVVADVEIR